MYRRQLLPFVFFSNFSPNLSGYSESCNWQTARVRHRCRGKETRTVLPTKPTSSPRLASTRQIQQHFFSSPIPSEGRFLFTYFGPIDTHNSHKGKESSAHCIRKKIKWNLRAIFVKSTDNNCFCRKNNLLFSTLHKLRNKLYMRSLIIIKSRHS